MKLPASILLVFLTPWTAVAETRVRITGMSGKSEAQVLDLIGDRLEHVTTKEASASRADDAAFLLSQVLRKDGYANVRVVPRVVSRNEIRLEVDEGGRLSLGAVMIQGAGAAAQQKELADLYSRPARKDQSLFAGRPPFREEDIESGLSNIRQELNAQGYWQAEAEIRSRSVNPASGEVSVVILVDRGPRYTIGLPRIISPDGRGVERTRTTTSPFVGRRATTANLNSLRAAVEEAFTSRGYPDARISMGRILEPGRFIPEIHIDLGQRVRLNRIHVAGLERTNPQRVLARTRVLEGDWYNEAAMNRRLRGFLATGAFSSARIETQEVAEKRIDATLHFEEARAKEVSLAVGADSYQGALFRTSYADRNLLGELLGFNIGLEFSARGVLGETSITDPWLFGSDVSGTARAHALIYGREGYSSFETGLEAKITAKFGDHYTLEALTAYSLVNLSEDGLPRQALGETVYTNPHLRLTQLLDYRDSSVLPTRGWHLRLPIELGGAVGDVSTSYVSASLNGGWYHRINADYQIGLGGEWGILVPSGDSQDLPIDLRLFNGGARSVRSFPERELGPQTEGYPIGGESMWNANAELIRSLGRTLRAVAFIDAGSLTTDFSDLGSGQLEIAAGLGLRLDLPVGPIRFEYGHNLTKDSGEPSGTFHFAIGVAY
jgi:outer membrane protein insertion porin family